MKRPSLKPPGRGAGLFKAGFKPRNTVTAVERRVFLCPICHSEIRQSTEVCPHCGGRRRFGPTILEITISILVGSVAGLTYCLTILGQVFWIAPCMTFGALVGFYVAQIRFDGDRWRKQK